MAPVHALLDRVWRWSHDALARQPDARWRSEFATAVAEIAANIVRHACHSTGDRCDPRLTIVVFPGQIEARFTDHGAPCLVPIPSGPPLISADLAAGWPESGLGLGLARAAVDDLHYERTTAGENRWRLHKWFVADSS